MCDGVNCCGVVIGASWAHFIVIGSRSRFVLWPSHILSIEWRRLDLVSQRLHLFCVGNGDIKILWDM